MISNTVEKTFIFTFPTCTTQQEYKLQIPLQIPFSGCVIEFTHRLMSSFKLPIYIENDLLTALSEFVSQETNNFNELEAEKYLQNLISGKIDENELIQSWDKAFTNETIEHSEPRGASDVELFAGAYHKLVHSPALETILHVEQGYALAVQDLIGHRDDKVVQLTEKQTSEMASAVQAMDEVECTEEEINQLAARHFEDQNLLQGRWNSEVDARKQSQRREYQGWLMRMLEDHQTNLTLTTPMNSPMSPLRMFHTSAMSSHIEDQSPRLEESFTIHLGSQMKQMHNVRLLAADVLTDFCQVKLQRDGSLDPQPQRLQTALALYSNDLCGLVLLADNHVGSFSGLTKDLSHICQSSTEFHFYPIDDQLERIRNDVKEAIAWRQANWKSKGQENSSSDPQVRRSGSSKHLQTGDVYVTHHSNLAEVHCVFHMVTDDSLRSNDINSRHPTILGLRNILKTACTHDITTLTLPLLLTHEMTNDMTVAWCTKRAELIFKCIKGFMIEMASWGGSELKNVQFLLPKGINEEIFAVLASMLPSIFRVSNPLVFKASSTPQTPKNF